MQTLSLPRPQTNRVWLLLAAVLLAVTAFGASITDNPITGDAKSASAATTYCSDRAYLHFVNYPTPSYPFVCYDYGVNQINIWSQYGGYYGGITPLAGFQPPSGHYYYDPITINFHADQWHWNSSTSTRFGYSTPSIYDGYTINYSQQPNFPMRIHVLPPLLHDELEWFAGGNGFLTIGRY